MSAQEDILHVTGQDTALDGSADGDHLVGVDALVGLAAEEVLHQLLDLRDTGATTDQQDLVDVGGRQVRIREGLAARLDAALEERVAEHLELGAGQGLHEVLGDAVHGHDVREVDLRGSQVRELDLRLLGRLFQALEGHRVLLQVDAAVLRGELTGQPVDDDLVEVVAAQMRVTVGGLHLEDAVAELQDGDIEGTAAEVIDRDLHVLVLLVQAVSQGRSRRLVDDTLDIQSRDLAGLLGRLTLGVREIGRDGDAVFFIF